LRQAHRIAADEQRAWTRDELMRLEADDILVDESGPRLQTAGLLTAADLRQPGRG
jgi:hypothetical protein